MLSKSKIKYIQSLGQKKFRDEESMFIAEGPKVVEELLQAPALVIQEIFAVKSWLEQHPGLPAQVTITEVSNADLEKISQLVTPNKVLAIIQKQQPVSLASPNENLTLALETIQDPGNLGTIIRIADWFGVRQVICSVDCADSYNPKVVQASMGSIARVNILYTDLEKWIRENDDAALFVTVLDGEDIRKLGKVTGGILCIGNESKGVSKKIIELAHKKISILGKGGAESLNAAVATGIILSHIT